MDKLASVFLLIFGEDSAWEHSKKINLILGNNCGDLVPKKGLFPNTKGRNLAVLLKECSNKSYQYIPRFKEYQL